MGRIIELSVNNETYKLEFNRDSLLEAYEISKGFDKVKDNSALENYTLIKKLVKCAFRKNHPTITDDEIGDIVYSIEDLESFIKAIQEIISNSVDVLSKKGNAHWVVK